MMFGYKIKAMRKGCIRECVIRSFHSFNFVYPRYPFRYLKKYLISQGAVLKSKCTKFKDVRLIINGYWLTIINGYWLTDKNLFLSVFLNFSRFSIA